MAKIRDILPPDDFREFLFNMPQPAVVFSLTLDQLDEIRISMAYYIMANRNLTLKKMLKLSSLLDEFSAAYQMRQDALDDELRKYGER